MKTNQKSKLSTCISTIRDSICQEILQIMKRNQKILILPLADGKLTSWTKKTIKSKRFRNRGSRHLPRPKRLMADLIWSSTGSLLLRSSWSSTGRWRGASSELCDQKGYKKKIWRGSTAFLVLMLGRRLRCIYGYRKQACRRLKGHKRWSKYHKAKT